MSNLTRRNFLKYSMATSTTVLICGTAATHRVFGANDRLRIGVAGVNGRGGAHIGGWLEQPNVEIAYLIDPDRNVLENRVKALEKRSKANTRAKECPTCAKRWKTRPSTLSPSPRRTTGTPL
jgi:hypothetical protein